MYYITREQWQKIPDGYRGRALLDHSHGGKTCKAGEKTCFLCFLPGAPKGAGAVLCFEHIHFEII